MWARFIPPGVWREYTSRANIIVVAFNKNVRFCKSSDKCVFSVNITQPEFDDKMGKCCIDDTQVEREGVQMLSNKCRKHRTRPDVDCDLEKSENTACSTGFDCLRTFRELVVP